MRTGFRSECGKESEGESNMRKFALMAVNTWLSYMLVNLQLMTSIVFILGGLEPVHAADFSCPLIVPTGSAMAIGDVSCLIAKINDANGMPGNHTINLEPGIYTLQMVDNTTDGPNGLPSIRRSIRIQASADDPPTVIERDPAAQSFRIFHVSVGGALSLEGLTVQRGTSGFSGGPAILNRGVTSLQDSVVTGHDGELGAVYNFGTLNVFRSTITDNFGGHDGGGIVNEAAGNVLVENSTIAHNGAIGPGGIGNFGGSLVVKNSAIISNNTDCCQSGGGILNLGGSVEIVNSTIAQNSAGVGGGGVYNSGGLVSITNSTIRENQVPSFPSGVAGGIWNDGGVLRVQNTVIAGNAFRGNAHSNIGIECFGNITSFGNNLVGEPTGCGVNLQPSDLTGDPGLGALTGTGEDDLPGRAHYPVLAGSPVIDRGNAIACLQTDQLGNLRAGVCDIGAVEFRGPMLVSVDIRPKTDANRINPNSTKKINVAIFSINGFDATAVNANSVRFGATGIEAPPIHGAIRDVIGDERFDMVLTFEIQSTGIRCGDTSASLTGQTSSGVSFIGSSPIKTVQCKKLKVVSRR
jgi:hypothetical protein